MSEADDFAGHIAVHTMLSYIQSLAEAAEWIAIGKTLGWSLDETKAYAMRAIAGGISAHAVRSALVDEPLRVVRIGGDRDER